MSFIIVQKFTFGFMLSVLTLIYLGSLGSGIPVGVVDLTHPLGPKALTWPGLPKFKLTILSKAFTSEGYWYAANSFQTNEHIGTHIDAPVHYYKEGISVHDIPIEKLIGPGVIINVKKQAKENPDYRVQISDLKAWEGRHGAIPDGAVVLMNSGWSDKYPDKVLTFGSESADDHNTLHFPGWHEDTVHWLIKNRNVNIVGVDTPSTDYGQSTTYSVHIQLGKASICGLEYVANLDSIPEAGTVISAALIKIVDGSGGPVRVFATLPVRSSMETESCTLD